MRFSLTLHKYMRLLSSKSIAFLVLSTLTALAYVTTLSFCPNSTMKRDNLTTFDSTTDTKRLIGKLLRSTDQQTFTTVYCTAELQPTLFGRRDETCSLNRYHSQFSTCSLTTAKACY